MSGLHAFLGGLIDYAGLFPPAQLPMEESLRNFARYRLEPEGWLLGRFVCPAALLERLAPLAQAVSGGSSSLALTVLGRGGKDAHEYSENVKADLADMASFREALRDRVTVDAYEVRLPPSACSAQATAQPASLISSTACLVESAGLPLLTPFFESPLADRAPVLALIQALRDDRCSSAARARRRCPHCGFKLRAGGLQPELTPSCALVALALTACAGAQVPFKATAGLHHPLRRAGADERTATHGFVNVFAAGCLALVHGLDEPEVLDIVQDENPAHFRVDDAGLTWRKRSATTAEIVKARAIFPSFGSCNFDEPRQDLRRMGWL